MTHVAPRIVNNVSFVTRINHEIHFSWQAPYLVSLDYDTCCSAHCKWRFTCDEDQSRDSFFVAGAQYLVKLKCHFSWQAQHLVKFKCHFSWHAQYGVKFGMIVLE